MRELIGGIVQDWLDRAMELTFHVSRFTPRVRLIGLLGYPVEHSLSPAMQNAAFAAMGLPLRYVLLPVSPDEFATCVQKSMQEGFLGWNVTVPHKERMLDHLDEMSEEVRA